jgi:hypothetical protein
MGDMEKLLKTKIEIEAIEFDEENPASGASAAPL